MRIREAADAVLRDLRVRRCSESLTTQMVRTLDHLASHLREKGVHDLRQVEEAHLVAFAGKLRASPLSLASQAVYLQRIKSAFGFLVRRGFLLSDPAAELVIPAASSLPRVVLSPRQAEKLVNTPSACTALGKRDRAILETLYGTGIRRGECVRLDVADIDLCSGTLLVRNGKGRKDRLVPIPERSARALDTYLRDVRPALMTDVAEPALFLTAWRGRRLSTPALVVVLRRHAQAAGIEHLHLHALRHTCATHLLRGGADLRHVQEILGHRSIKTTALYTRVNLADLRQVIARAHPRERAFRRKQAVQ